MKNLTETELLSRKRALHAGTILSKVSIAAAVFLLLSAFASLFVMLFAGLAAVLLAAALADGAMTSLFGRWFLSVTSL